MRVVHVLLAGASRYDRSCAAIDLGIGPGVDHELFEAVPAGWRRNGSASTIDELSALLRSSDASVLHVHGSSPPPARLLSGLAAPWISDRRLAMPRSLFRRFPGARLVLADQPVPEGAGDEWFVEHPARTRRNGPRRVGSFARTAEVRNNSAQAYGRIQRFRDDVEWTLFDEPPSPRELAELDLWIDPASAEDDVDGMVVEAIACRTPVVAARTEVNLRRLDHGRAGLLSPLRDHNEMTHAILGALFKNEVSIPLRTHAERIRDRFRPHHRRNAVARIYAEVAT